MDIKIDYELLVQICKEKNRVFGSDRNIPVPEMEFFLLIFCLVQVCVTEIRTDFCKYQLLSLYLYYGSYTQYK